MSLGLHFKELFLICVAGNSTNVLCFLESWNAQHPKYGGSMSVLDVVFWISKHINKSFSFKPKQARVLKFSHNFIIFNFLHHWLIYLTHFLWNRTSTNTLMTSTYSKLLSIQKRKTTNVRSPNCHLLPCTKITDLHNDALFD